MTLLRKLTIQRLMMAILFILLFAMAVRTPTDTDTWWHIRSGEYIVRQREIPRTDLFSHTRFGEEWIDHSWGSQLIMYGTYELFGGGTRPGDSGNIGLSLYMAVLATVGMAFVYLMCEGNVYIRAFVVVLGAATAAVFWSPRPQMFSFMLGALVLYLLHLYKRRQIDRLWLIPFIMAVWANLHGGFAIGFIFLFGFIAGEILGNLFNSEDEHVVRWGRLKKVVLVTAVAIPAVALNPYGVQMLAYLAVRVAAAGRPGRRRVEPPPHRLDRSGACLRDRVHGIDGRAEYRRLRHSCLAGAFAAPGGLAGRPGLADPAPAHCVGTDGNRQLGAVGDRSVWRAGEDCCGGQRDDRPPGSGALLPCGSR